MTEDAPDILAAILENDLDGLRRAVARNPTAVKERWRETLTAVSCAIGIDAYAFLRFLTEESGTRRRGVALDDSLDDDGNTIAHWCALYGHIAKLRALERLGADLRIPNRLGTTPAFDAVRGADPEATDFMLSVTPRETLRRPNLYDCTIMHWACKHASLVGVRALHGRDPDLLNAPNSRGCLPLDVLAWRGLYQADVVRRTHGREPCPEEARPFLEIDAWMRASGARHSDRWLALPADRRLRTEDAPLNAALWWRYVRSPGED